MFFSLFSDSRNEPSLNPGGPNVGAAEVFYPKTRLIPRDSYGTPLLNPMEIEVRERLINRLEADSLFD